MFIVSAFQEGGPFMYVILAFGVAAAAVIIERAMTLHFQWKEAPKDFREQLLKLMEDGNLQAAETLAVSTQTSLGKIAATGIRLQAHGAGEEVVQARMDEALTDEISAIDKRTGFLAMLGNVATLVGLLGTISGMIHSFAAVATANPMDRATMLSKGISEAMNCTAFGLIVAVPALVAFSIFQNKTDTIVATLTETTTKIYHDLVFLFEPSAQPRPRSAKQAERTMTVQ